MDCPDKFFRNLKGDCQKCSHGCQTCISQTSCQICEPYFTLINDECNYEDTTLKNIGPIIALTIVLIFILGFLFVIWYIKYLQKKKRQQQANDLIFYPPDRLNRKFSQEMIQKVIQHHQENQVHVICLFCRKDGVNTETKCHHKFHWKCIQEWLAFSSCCPVCKTTEVLPLISLANSRSYDEGNEAQQDQSGKAIVLPSIESYHVLNEESPEKIK